MPQQKLTDLPRDMLNTVVDYLTPISIAKLSQTCGLFARLTAEQRAQFSKLKKEIKALEVKILHLEQDLGSFQKEYPHTFPNKVLQYSTNSYHPNTDWDQMYVFGFHLQNQRNAAQSIRFSLLQTSKTDIAKLTTTQKKEIESELQNLKNRFVALATNSEFTENELAPDKPLAAAHHEDEQAPVKRMQLG